jgi:hypothetical protein
LFVLYPDIIREIKSEGEMGGACSGKVEKRIALNILMGKPEEKIPTWET